MADVDDDSFTFSDFISQPQPLQNGDVFAHLFFSQPRPDPFPTPSDPPHKPNGPTPSSLFCQIGHSGVSSDSNRVGPNNIFGKFVDIPNNQILPGNGSGLSFDGLHSKSCNVVENEGEEDDEWEFKGADFDVLHSLEEKGQSLSFGSKVEVFPVMEMIQHKQAGQDASILIGYEPGPSNSLPPQSVDLFALRDGGVDKSNDMDLFNFNFTPVTTNDFTSSLFPGSQEIDKENKMSANSVNEDDDDDDDDDDFGDFLDASPEVQTGGKILPQMKTTEEQFHNKTIQDKQRKQENNGGALPLSLFSDLSEESSDILEPQDNVIQKPVSYPANGFISQGTGISLHDLISNLYSQSQPTSSVVCSDQNPAENGVHFSPQERDSNPPGDVDDDWDDNSWEFKDAFSENGFREHLYSQNPYETSSHLQVYIEFYGTMREALCFLLSHQLKEIEETQYSDPAVGDDGKVNALGNDVQEAYKLLKDNMVDKEALSKEHLEAGTCLNEVLRSLQDPKFKVIELQYSLSKKLQLAANDWRVASELLRHVISVLDILSLGSSDDHKVYVSTWSKLVNVCNKELKYGALIWKRASENNLQHQSLSDHRGVQNILALGEIYKVAELVGLSAKLYMPWMLLSVPMDFSGPLDECRTLWSSSGLEQILQNISENVDFGCYESAKALIASINNICDDDVVTVHDFVFNQRKPLCRLSLLPLDILADLKTVLWKEEPYFVNLANLWANLISNNPPELPHLQVSQ